MDESNIKFFSRRWVCRLFRHQYCKCGWCKRHPICIRCNYDKVCNIRHPDLRNGLICQDGTYDLLEVIESTQQFTLSVSKN